MTYRVASTGTASRGSRVQVERQRAAYRPEAMGTPPRESQAASREKKRVREARRTLRALPALGEGGRGA
jgi:hypothetical protein